MAHKLPYIQMALGKKKKKGSLSLPKGHQGGLRQERRQERTEGSALIWAPSYSCGPGLSCCPPGQWLCLSRSEWEAARACPGAVIAALRSRKTYVFSDSSAHRKWSTPVLASKDRWHCVSRDQNEFTAPKPQAPTSGAWSPGLAQQRPLPL